MATDPRAIDAYLARKLRDANRWKNADVDGIREFLLEREGELPRYELEPFLHQWVCLAIGIRYRRYYFALDMGLGKSKVALDLFRWYKDRGVSKRALVLVPNVTNLGQWIDQASVHAPDCRVVALDAKSRPAREKQWASECDVLVATYAGARAMLCGKVPRLKGRAPIPEKIAAARKAFDYFVLDEATQIGDSRSVTFRMLSTLTDSDAPLYQLSGSMYSTDPQRLWPQLFLLDRGDLLGKFSLFREVFFREQQTPWATEYKLISRMRDVLHRRIRHIAIRYKEDEALDLPDRVGGVDNPQRVPVAFNVAQWRATKAVCEDVASLFDKSGIVDPTAYKQLRCILAGYVKDPALGYTNLAGCGSVPKFEAAIELLQDIFASKGNAEKIILVHTYQETGRRMERRLEQAKIGFASLRSGSSPKNLPRWRREPGTPVLLVSTAAAYGLDLQECCYMVFLESPDSIEKREQLERRIYRIGQKRAAHYYDIVTPNSVDEAILARYARALRERRSVVDGKAAR